jgi:multiple sugar transport system substrate-binding protein
MPKAMTKSRFAVAAVAVLGHLAFRTTTSHASTRPEARHSPVSITYISYNYESAGLGGEGTQELLNQFHDEYPWITVDAVASSAANTEPLAQADVAAGNIPDVVEVGWAQMPQALESLPIVPISRIETSSQLANLKTNLFPSVLAAGEVNGKLTAMPYAFSTPTLFINASLFGQAGLDPQKPPTNWTEVQQDALQIKSRTSAQGFYIAIANAAGSPFITESLFNSNGGTLLAKGNRADIDSPQDIAALESMQQLTQSGAMPNITDPAAEALFQAGKLGMYITSTALTAGFLASANGNFTLDTAPMPGYGTKTTHTTYSGAGLVVLSQSKAKRAAASDFVSFMVSRLAEKITTEDIGYLPLRSDVATLSEFLGNYFKSNPLVLPAFKQLEQADPYQNLPGPNSGQATALLQNDAVQPIVFEGANAASTLSSVQSQIQALISG